MRQGCGEKESKGRGREKYRQYKRAKGRQKRKRLAKNILNTLKGFHFFAFKKENIATTIGGDVPYLLSLLRG